MRQYITPETLDEWDREVDEDLRASLADVSMPPDVVRQRAARVANLIAEVRRVRVFEQTIQDLLSDLDVQIGDACIRDTGHEMAERIRARLRS